MTDKERRQQFIKAVIEYLDEKHITVKHSAIDAMARYMAREESRLNRMAILECSDEEYCRTHLDAQANNAERISEENKVRKYIDKACGIKMPLTFNHDPRGMMIKLDIRCKKNNNFHNCFDGESSGVNWR